MQLSYNFLMKSLNLLRTLSLTLSMFFCCVCYSNEYRVAPIDSWKANRALDNIKQRIKNSPAYATTWMETGVFELIEKSAKRFLNNDKIYPINAELSAFYKKNCTPKESCNLLLNFYLPSSDLIFVSTEDKNRNFTYGLFHELIHVYQFDHRLLIDLAVIDQAVKEGTLKESEVYDFLNFFYETQAHWYTLTVMRELNPEWWAYGNDPTDFSDPNFPSLDELSRFLPESFNNIGIRGNSPNQIERYTRFPRENRPYINPTDNSAYLMPNLVIINGNQTAGKMVFKDNFNWKLHNHYTELLEKYQFKQLAFLSEKRRKNSQKVLTNLQNNFFRLFHKQKLHNSCSLLFQKAYDRKTDAFTFWEKLEPVNFKLCGQLKHLESAQYRKQLLDTYKLGSNASSSPFLLSNLIIKKEEFGSAIKIREMTPEEIRKNGSSQGTTPELEIKPGMDKLIIFPHLLIKPEN